MRLSQLFFALVLSVSLLASATGKARHLRQTGLPPNWNVKYKSGSFQLKNGQWLKAAFMSDVPVARHASPIISISPAQIRTIYFDPKAQKSSDTAQRMQRSGCAYAMNRMPNGDTPASVTFIIWEAPPSPILRAAERLNQRHPLRIVWNDSGIDRELTLTVNDCEYASFMANLRWFLGQRWQETAHQFLGKESGSRSCVR
jgi:hypothetical protein